MSQTSQVVWWAGRSLIAMTAKLSSPSAQRAFSLAAVVGIAFGLYAVVVGVQMGGWDAKGLNGLSVLFAMPWIVVGAATVIVCLVGEVKRGKYLANVAEYEASMAEWRQERREAAETADFRIPIAELAADRPRPPTIQVAESCLTLGAIGLVSIVPSFSWTMVACFIGIGLVIASWVFAGYRTMRAIDRKWHESRRA